MVQKYLDGVPASEAVTGEEQVITIAHTFYDQHNMLPLHTAAWANHPPGVRHVLVDDCSPTPIACHEVPSNVAIYRIDRDIPWNMAGARNLAFHVAQTDWVLSADIDHVITAETLLQLRNLDYADDNVAHRLKRRRSDGSVGTDAIICILMNRARYIGIGGHDEDFAGSYGREETFFDQCLRYQGVTIRTCHTAFVDWHGFDGRTRGLVRCRQSNTQLFDQKMALLRAGTYTAGARLRFPWHVVQAPEPGGGR